MMSANVIKSNPIYTEFHDMRSTSNKNEKETELDNSIYQLLSIYLSTEKLELPSVTQSKRYQRPTHPHVLERQNWFGEAKRPMGLLERNTLLNSRKAPVKTEPIKRNKSARSKSVTFNETVIIISQDDDNLSTLSNLNIEEDDEEHYFDALESITV